MRRWSWQSGVLWMLACESSGRIKNTSPAAERIVSTGRGVTVPIFAPAMFASAPGCIGENGTVPFLACQSMRAGRDQERAVVRRHGVQMDPRGEHRGKQCDRHFHVRHARLARRLFESSQRPMPLHRDRHVAMPGERPGGAGRFVEKEPADHAGRRAEDIGQNRHQRLVAEQIGRLRPEREQIPRAISLAAAAGEHGIVRATAAQRRRARSGAIRDRACHRGGVEHAAEEHVTVAVQQFAAGANGLDPSWLAERPSASSFWPFWPACPWRGPWRAPPWPWSPCR